ncbi:Uncharacterised protein [Mycobacterium tuberculosis]|nr:Uncharacterised protein [Mycobacterium tuberculosis]
MATNAVRTPARPAAALGHSAAPTMITPSAIDHDVDSLSKWVPAPVGC